MNSLIGVLPVSRVDGREMPVGDEPPVAQALHKAPAR